MNKTRRKEVLKILKSGWSAVNISNTIGLLFNIKGSEVLRLIQNAEWEHKRILQVLDNFVIAKYPISKEYTELYGVVE